jgi:hypothetical protein
MISWRIQIDMLLPPELHDDSLARKLPDGSYICLRVNKPGIHTDMSWESLELFANDVMPYIQVCKPEDIATPVVDRIPWAEQG